MSVFTKTPSYGQATVGLTARKIISSPLSTRGKLYIKNMDSASRIFLGFDSNVTTSNGYLVKAGDEEIFDISDSIDVYGVSATANISVCYIELA